MKIREQLKCELARREFWEYCKLMFPAFYKEDRKYLKQLCETLQDFYYNDQEFMIINLPPRHGKSFTATNYAQWILGKDPTYKIISASYNSDLSVTFSKQVRSVIETEKLDNKIIYNDIFTNTKLKYGSSRMDRWQTDRSSQVNYLATSPGGSATGFGAHMEIIDDLIKNAFEANNAKVLEDQWDWFTNTMLSRREGKKKVLIIMTRWNSKDLAGRIIEYVKDEGLSYSHINMKALENNKMLCEDIFSLEDYNRALKVMGEDIFSANYQQEPIDLKGALYQDLMTYDKLPDKIRTIDNYTDTADTGSDFLCSIDYAVDSDKNAYIIDVVYTKESMEITENKVAEMITKDKVNFCRIESNNGGRGFSRNVERISKGLGNRTTLFKPFHQSKNKLTRILTGSTAVMKNIYFPSDWKYRFPEFYRDVISYQREGKNAHDDCADVLTGITEQLEKNSGNFSGRRL